MVRSMKFRLKQHPIINNLEKHFAEKSRDLKFYDFPAYWKDEKIYSTLQKVGYIERLVVKRSYKYKTVRTNIHLSKEMEAIFIIKGGSNITIKKYSWQVVKKLEESEVSKEDCLLIKEYIGIYKGHFRYQSTMEDEMGKGLQIKGQNEIIGRMGNLLDCGIET
ncbi:hypothetical protein GLOIN_2v1666204 [Rhizophagus irregularis DAOM 181602=DAOM 197198]|nr:hypothetical protein GLOIN_2v1666204 [Rhizophagus irregularis DAOM 181602=DAOM 197198]